MAVLGWLRGDSEQDVGSQRQEEDVRTGWPGYQGQTGSSVRKLSTCGKQGKEGVHAGYPPCGEGGQSD